MNRSIAKTRNQLQRITFKINQLKTKYSGDVTPPLSSSSLSSQGQLRLRDVQENRPLPTPKSSHSAKNTDETQKQIKGLKHQIYAYVDRVISSFRDRESQEIESIVTQILAKNGRNNTSALQSRIQRLEEQTTNCITSLDELDNKSERLGNKVEEKIQYLDRQIQRQIQNNLDNYGIERVLSRVSTLDASLAALKDENSRDKRKYNEIYDVVESVKQELQRVDNSFVKKFNEFKSKMCQLEETIQDKIQEQLSLTANNFQSLSTEFEQLKIRSQILNDLQKGVEKPDWTKNMEDMIDLKLNQNSKQIEKLFQDKVDELELQKDGLQILHSKIGLIEANFLSLSGDNQRYHSEQQIIQEKLNNLSQSLEQYKEQIFLKVQNRLLEHSKTISSFSEKAYDFANQQKKIEKMVLQEQFTRLSDQLSMKIDGQIKDLMSQIIQNQRKKSEVSEKQLNQIPTTSTLPPMQCCSVDEKLSQFEADVNETIKLLYADIEERVNLMITHFMESESSKWAEKIETLDQQQQQIETRLTSISHIVGQDAELPRQIENDHDQRISPRQVSYNDQRVMDVVEQLREQVFTEMGAQVERISNVVERTIEEMQMKVEKLQNNFGYVYQRMSTIEFDNANFKDKLTAFIPSLQQPSIEAYSSESQPLDSSSSTNFLDVLGQYTSGGMFEQLNN